MPSRGSIGEHILTLEDEKINIVSDLQCHQRCRHDQHDQRGEWRALLGDAEKFWDNRLAEKRLDELIGTLRTRDELDREEMTFQETG